VADPLIPAARAGLRSKSVPPLIGQLLQVHSSTSARNMRGETHLLPQGGQTGAP